MIIRRLLLLASVSFFAYSAAGQDTGDAPAQEIDYRPVVFGALKAKFETSLYSGMNRFNVRNTRVGIDGHASPFLTYRVQIDFSNEGNVTFLDAYAVYSKGSFEASLGQQQYYFSSDVTRGPNSNIFANRSFIAKFVTSYYGSNLVDGAASYYVKSIGSRDLGAAAHYTLRSIPLRFTLGAYSGSGINNPQWRNTMNVVGRIEYGAKEGFGAAVSHYNGYTSVEKRVVYTGSVPAAEDYKQRVRMWDVELRYSAGDLWLQAEYAQRRLKEEGLKLLQGAHVQGYYQFRLAEKYDIDYIAPVLRWDMGRDIEFLNKAGAVERFSAHRATAGVNFGFVSKIVGAELRLNFEKYFLDGKPSDYSRNPLLQDKFTIEVVATF